MHPPDEETEVSTLMVTAEEKQRLEAAAAFLGVTVEEFVVTAAYPIFNIVPPKNGSHDYQRHGNLLIWRVARQSFCFVVP
jgi:hypothetical protein